VEDAAVYDCVVLRFQLSVVRKTAGGFEVGSDSLLGRGAVGVLEGFAVELVGGGGGLGGGGVAE